jgi:shikimate kinase
LQKVGKTNMDASADSTFISQKNCYFLTGFMGSGKSHWGKIWAAGNQLSFLDLDEVIEAGEGATIAAIFETKGEDYFRNIEAAALRSCAGLENTIIACGGGTPCFHDNMRWMNAHGTTIYIACTSEEILDRVFLEKEKRPLLKKLSKAELLFFIEQKVKERESFYTKARYTVQSGVLTQYSFPEIISTILS